MKNISPLPISLRALLFIDTILSQIEFIILFTRVEKHF